MSLVVPSDSRDQARFYSAISHDVIQSDRLRIWRRTRWSQSSSLDATEGRNSDSATIRTAPATRGCRHVAAVNGAPPWAEADAIEEIEIWVRTKGVPSSSTPSALRRDQTPTLEEFRRVWRLAGGGRSEPANADEFPATGEDLDRLLRGSLRSDSVTREMVVSSALGQLPPESGSASACDRLAVPGDDVEGADDWLRQGSRVTISAAPVQPRSTTKTCRPWSWMPEGAPPVHACKSRYLEPSDGPGFPRHKTCSRAVDTPILVDPRLGRVFAQHGVQNSRDLNRAMKTAGNCAWASFRRSEKPPPLRIAASRTASSTSQSTSRERPG
jgi:hypothetical protein